MITQLLALMGLMICYNTTDMTTIVVDYPNKSQVKVLDESEKDLVRGLGLSIYGLTVKDYGLLLCAKPYLNDKN